MHFWKQDRINKKYVMTHTVIYSIEFSIEPQLQLMKYSVNIWLNIKWFIKPMEEFH